MNKIEQMVKEMCPGGVKMTTIGEACEILDYLRKPISKANRIAGKYPYYGANGIQDWVSGYILDGTYILLGEDGSVINPDKSPIMHFVSGKIWVNNHAHILKEINNQVNLKNDYPQLTQKKCECQIFFVSLQHKDKQHETDRIYRTV